MLLIHLMKPLLIVQIDKRKPAGVLWPYAIF